MDKLKMHSPDMTQQNIEKIQALFPNCVTESRGTDGELKLSIDFDQLKQELSNSIVEGPQERYQLNWPGKREALLTANAPIAKTLRPCREESVNFDTTENLFIEGDNLDALKMLQETYLGKVKMIYIDPPYNTGKDFIYADDFAENTEEYLKSSGQKDLVGNRMVANTENNGRFHSDWLSMMYSRLKLARNLLKDDGVIFISIDDEMANLKKVCDEIFGEDNFIENISWNKRIPKNDKGVGNIHEYILIYAKNSECKPEFTMRKDGLDDIYELAEKLKKQKVPIAEANEEIKKLYKKNGYDRGITLYNSFDNEYRLWGKINMSWPNANTFGPTYPVKHPITGNPVKIPDRGWRWKEETFNEAAKIVDGSYTEIVELHDGGILCGKVWFSKKDDQQPSSVTYLDDVNSFLLRSILSTKSDGGIEVENLFSGKSYFSYPKSTSLLKVLISSYKNRLEQGEIILDFFAGSSTTADAILRLNAEDGMNRKFIMVQLPESCDEKTEAYKAGYKTIAEISKERIRRAGVKILAGECHKDWNKDVGFRVLKVDTSNMADVYYSPDQVSQGSLNLLVDNIKSDRTDEDLLFQVLLDWGVDLTLPIRKETIQGKSVFFVDDDALVACFDLRINEALIKELATKEPLRVVFRDDGFESDAVKINAEQIFKQVSPHTEVKAI
ncbi:site-specific DNA-methyltransferase (plasmid) [Escherichia coli]|uniref:site-specific DNA-methyltransferase n=2 Tax=Escherichia coli TaxID=562 RepID=UPI0015EA89E9|nr:site-specific DNA-methyltransferase [Escherichia coli]EFL4046445.1 site-specific DNA-methyltransferase [Escherichia coli]EFL9430432.1 site-specific DNA-methyltransferase [Escherichia coli]MCK2331514.1 site-specific DNA-methyltransferase [Escherichia coli]MCN8006052.1 site-specific DNA-methyltransferase [Escherichia coli]